MSAYWFMGNDTECHWLISRHWLNIKLHCYYYLCCSLSLTGYNESQSLNLSRSSHESLFLKSFHFRNKSLALLIAPKWIRIHYNALKKINHFLNDTDLSDSDRSSVRYGECHIKSVLAVIKLLNSFIKILKSNIFHVFFLTRVRSTL